MFGAMASCVVVGLLGLSRAFFLALAVWAAMYIISKKVLITFLNSNLLSLSAQNMGCLCGFMFILATGCPPGHLQSFLNF